MEEIHQREVEFAAEQARVDEAVNLIQSVVRRRKAGKAFRTLISMIKASGVTQKGIRNWRKRRRRQACLVLQAHARAYICYKLQICSYGVLLVTIYGLRAWSARAISRMVQRRFLEIKLAEQAAAYAYPRQTVGQALAGIRPHADTTSSGAALTSNTALARRRLGRKVLLAGRSVGRDAMDALKTSLPRPPTISARLPLFSTVVPAGQLKVMPHQQLPIHAFLYPPSLAHSPRGFAEGQGGGSSKAMPSSGEWRINIGSTRGKGPSSSPPMPTTLEDPLSAAERGALQR